MPKTTLRKVNWTLVFDAVLKDLVIKTARQKSVQPATILEDLVVNGLALFGE